MYTRERTAGDHKGIVGQRPLKVAARSMDGTVQQLNVADAVQRARLDPGSLTANDARQIQRTLGNRATGKIVSRTAQPHARTEARQLQSKMTPGAVVQRWPEITSDDGTDTKTFRVTAEFRNRHMADTIEQAKAKAWAAYDPYNTARGASYVTIIHSGSLEKVAKATFLGPEGGYALALTATVQAVMIKPTGRAGANGDPGVMQEVQSVTLGARNDPNPGRSPGRLMITHLETGE